MSRFSKVCRASSQLGLIVAATGVLGLVAGAQSAPTLQGETFQTDGKNSSRVQCPLSAFQAGTIVFDTTGVATGPVPGYFQENGQITINGPRPSGALSFNIFDPASGQSIASGTKTITDGSVTCVLDGKTGVSTFVVNANLTYEATVHGVTDAGEATLDMAGVSQKSATSSEPFQFTEIFHSSKFANTPGKVTGGGQIAGVGTGVTFGFSAQSDGTEMKGSGTVIDRTMGIRIKLLTVQAFGQVGTRAAFSGKAEVNGVHENYRIDVDDLAEPGAAADTFKIVTDTYTTAGTLTGGNVQTHK